MIKIAIIGASYLQLPLIKKAQEMGYETHVFAWKANDVGERQADYFYPISIVEKEAILAKCQEIGIGGICSIASDLANITVNYVANKMGLVGNSDFCTEVTTNKSKMRHCFLENNDPSPKSIRIVEASELDRFDMNLPLIVKPLDRSGSRGITKITSYDELASAIDTAKEQGFEKAAIVEEFAEGQEYSVEYISYEGKHTFLALTQKYTSGSPNFVETAHIEPAPVSADIIEKVKLVTEHALTDLDVKYGASHSELKVDSKGNINIIEIGSRMGGDCIGSSLVKLSTGYDFVENVIRICMGQEPSVNKNINKAAAIRFIFNNEDVKVLDRIKQEHPEYLVEENVEEITQNAVKQSADRFGYYIIASDSVEDLLVYMPQE